MTIGVKVERTATVTITLDEREASYLAALIGNVGGDDSNNIAVRMCRDIFTALLDKGFTPPRFRDVYEWRNQGIIVSGATPNGCEAPK